MCCCALRCNRGRILIDGVDIRDMKRSDLRPNRLCAQKIMLFSGTVTSNLRYADGGATLDHLQRAACVAQADEFIIGMTDGYDARVCPGGSNLSGGQKQRLSIAGLW
ncbi:MAG: ATP-binding cassette domain-containing protein [Caldilineaceae bacterium]